MLNLIRKVYDLKFQWEIGSEIYPLYIKSTVDYSEIQEYKHYLIAYIKHKVKGLTTEEIEDYLIRHIDILSK